MQKKTWFITGASRGFGREFTVAALERGDNVAATARYLATLDDLTDRFGDRLLPLELDVSDRDADVRAVRRAHETFGRIDVLVNNAGYGHFGAFEELTEAELREQFDTNFFGAVWITQAVLPHMRAQKSGRIIQMSSIGGVLAFPSLSAYHASKWALEGVSESLAAEVAPLGIGVTLVEPGAFGTDWAGPSSVWSTPMPEYEHVHEANKARREGLQFGSPNSAAEALLAVVDAPDPPLRVFFGSSVLDAVEPVYRDRLQNWRDWQRVAEQAQG